MFIQRGLLYTFLLASAPLLHQAVGLESTLSSLFHSPYPRVPRALLCPSRHLPITEFSLPDHTHTHTPLQTCRHFYYTLFPGKYNSLCLYRQLRLFSQPSAPLGIPGNTIFHCFTRWSVHSKGAPPGCLEPHILTSSSSVYVADTLIRPFLQILLRKKQRHIQGNISEHVEIRAQVLWFVEAWERALVSLSQDQQHPCSAHGWSHLGRV